MDIKNNPFVKINNDKIKEERIKEIIKKIMEKLTVRKESGE